MKEKDHLEDPGLDGRIIINGSSGSEIGGIDCVDLAQHSDRWRAVMILQVPWNQ
jgi:hypothetical protein